MGALWSIRGIECVRPLEHSRNRVHPPFGAFAESSASRPLEHSRNRGHPPFGAFAESSASALWSIRGVHPPFGASTESSASAIWSIRGIECIRPLEHSRNRVLPPFG